MADGAPLRILHCFRSPVGGIFRHVRDLAEEHSRAGHAVGILCDSTTGGAYEDALFDGIRPHLALGLTRLPIRRSVSPSDLKAAAASLKKIKSLKPDVLHGHGAKGGTFARIIGSRLRVSGYRVARLYSPHGGSLHYAAGSLAGRFYFGVERMLERWTDSLVFVSDYERRTYFQKIGKPRSQWQLVYNGLRKPEFEPVDTPPQAADFLYIGMMRDLKGPDVFIDAFERAEGLCGRTLSAVMVGDGDDKPRYMEMIERRRLSGRISMHPAMPARKAFAMARTVCVPSRAESMPYIVLEALAAGKPLIATNVGGIPEILGSDNPALGVPGDSADLANLLARAVTEPNWLASVMPETHLFRSRFSAKTMADEMLALYRECLSEAPRIAIEPATSSLS